MCGRFVVARTVGEIQTIFEADEIIGDLPGISYNVAPTQPITIIVDRAFEKAPDGSPIAFTLPSFRRDMLLSGADELEVTLRRRGAIEAWQANARRERPWEWLPR